MYVNDMVAVERDIKQALDVQADDERVVRLSEVAAVLREAVASSDARLSAMDSLAKSLGGSAGHAVSAGCVVLRREKWPLSGHSLSVSAAFYQSRTGIAAMVVIYFLGIYLRKPHWKEIGTEIIRVTLFFALSSFLDTVSLQYLTNTKPQIHENNSLSLRIKVWGQLFNSWLESPWFDRNLWRCS